MDDLPVVPEKHYGRGEHPNSRANLIPYGPGQNGHNLPAAPPYIRPALAKFAGMTVAEIRALNPDKLSPGQAIVRAAILDAVENPEAEWRLKAFDRIADRADGPLPRDGAQAAAQAVANVYIYRGGPPLGV